ncbi:hypothetical protein COCSADRAFT_37713 [Bipolaris sorokiniana ND90Pr]|uniref:Uncharacterized protein n=1 Tax=Cochliobolus sativus (strain ND90Pr / ATCC 201652) TaxID=665912 RepID=M2T1B2_COCSN|nr:uncharacterized protein COCSADRAFT_37713 [Bipolaris sorokiniana ND90Pr]EMD62812.1 hypothetical protein COCSADRAFT_37713 [Bipolaris sorokiniana ND90Pr]
MVPRQQVTFYLFPIIGSFSPATFLPQAYFADRTPAISPPAPFVAAYPAARNPQVAKHPKIHWFSFLSVPSLPVGY